MTAQPSMPGTDRRDCALYRFWVRHPTMGRIVLGYVGETVRMPFVRLMEHIYDQPWSDTIVRWEVDSTVYAGKAAVLAAEKAAIESERPLYNVECNMGNPLRIKPWEAVAQRQAREPGWQPPVRGARVPRQRRTATAASTPTAVAAWAWEWTPERIKVAAWAGGWLAVTCVVGWQAASGPVATSWDGIAYGAGIATSAVGLLLPGKRRRRRRRSRR
ncbi:hypothetical protein [Micromonospora sp. CA-248212]|uniref:hypothetical protein n=1 Tax=Micromonospora sp. CA-248212 TaxID=3239961 RepID=UPI003D94F972